MPPDGAPVELDPRGAAEVLAVLDRLEAASTVPRIEAAERRRLVARAEGVVASPDHAWTPRLVDGWYLGLRTRTGDAAVIGETGRLGDGTVAAPLATADAAGAVRVWLRGGDPDDVTAADAAGWRVRRALLVLGRDLSDVAALPAPDGLRLVAAQQVEPAAVAELLDLAYAGPRRDGLVEADPDAGAWTVERFARVAAVALDDPSDLLVAVDDDGRVVGVHWTGRRAGAVGEVFNLAVDPACAGRGVAAWLLGAGLAHLRAAGHREVVLWVDERNAPARALYERAGFAERGRDVALGR